MTHSTSAVPPAAVEARAAQPACLVCGGAYGPSPLPGLFRCQSCGFLSADLSIPDEDLARLYGEDYFHGEEYRDYIAEEASLKLNFRDRIATLRRLIPGLDGKDLLELGCAYGFFLDEVRGAVRSARGMDISADAVRHAVERKGVEAMQGDYLATEFGRQFDLVTLWDTIEHLKRPDLFVAKAARDLVPGGHLAVTTGDIGSLNARWRGRRWRMIHPPTHLHYFSVATLSRLLDRHGFDVVHVSHPGNSRDLRSILHFILVLQMKRPGLYAALQRIPLFDLRLTLNLYDIMFVVARRRVG